MKQILSIAIFCMLKISVSAQEAKTLAVKQDAYVVGGEKATTTFGVTDSNQLRVKMSDENNKYARSAYLMFQTDKKQDPFKNIVLNINVKAYKNEKDSSSKFILAIYGVENDKWSESSLHAKNAPEKSILLAEKELEPMDGWVQIELDAAKVNTLFDGKKDRKITLLLKDEAKTGNGIQIASKDKAWTNGQSAKSGAYLTSK